MTSEEELNKFRRQEKFRQERARVPSIVIGTFIIIAVVAMAYGFYQQIIQKGAAVEYESQLRKTQKAFDAAEERAGKFETLALKATARANEISDQCQRKTPKSK